MDYRGHYTVFFTLCLLAFSSFIISLVFLYKAYSGYTYAYFPTEKMVKVIKETYDKTSSLENGKAIANAHINSMFTDLYAHCAVLNERQNCLKNNRHRNFTSAITISFVLVGVAYVYNMIFIENTHL